jgi:hypothetical protein
MKKLFAILVFTLLFVAPSIAQENYMIFLKNKGFQGNFSFNSSLWNMAYSSLSVESINRRIKHLGDKEFLSFEDLPVSLEYISRLEMTGAKIRWALKWFDCVSVSADKSTLEKIEKLDFVSYVRPVIRIKVPLDFRNAANPLQDDQLATSASTSQRVYNNNVFTTLPSEFSSDLVPISAGDEDTKLYGSSYIQYKLSDVPQVNKIGGKGRGIKIGILDSGFDWQKHDALKTRKVIAEYDFVKKDRITANQTGDRPSQHDHGTFCFSVCGGYLEGKLIGPAHDAEFVLAKTEDTESERMVEEDNYAAAIQWMDSIGVDITSSSLGYTVFDDTTYRYEDLTGNTAICTKAINYAFSKGILSFTASGNSAGDTWYYVSTPGDGYKALAIGAVSKNREIADFSSGGPTVDGRIKPDFSTMGISVFGAMASTNNKFERSNGTSAATPIAAGIGGQLLSLFPHLKNTQARFILMYSSDQRYFPDNLYGYGLLSSLEAATHPNLEVLPSGDIKLHKRFKNDVRTKSVYLHFKTGYKKSDKLQMTKQDDGYYTVILPTKAKKEALEFWFDAGEKTNGVNYPSTDRTYYTIPGNENVFITTPSKIDFKKIGNERLVKFTGVNPRIFVKSKLGVKTTEVVITDIAGNYVVTLPVSNIGMDNRIIWDGKNYIGKKVPFGIYRSTVFIDNRPSTVQVFIRK